MKKVICVALCFSLITMLFCGCRNKNTDDSNYSDEVIIQEIVIDETDSVISNQTIQSEDKPLDKDTTTPPDMSSQKTPSSNDPSKCSHNYDNITVEQTAQLFKAGVKRYTCSLCGDSYTGTYPLEKIKILSIGNSYSLNSMNELYSICKQAGVKQIDIAIMYIAGCSINKHWENIQQNNATYELHRNNSGEWKITNNYSIEQILSENDWDVISLQNSPTGASNITGNDFAELTNLTNYLGQKCPNSTLVWFMTWAFKKGCEYLYLYNEDEILMYNNIVSSTKSEAASNAAIHSVAPIGTAIMNARTSRVRDNVHLSDGSHLSKDIGYYVGALTWFGYLTGVELYDAQFSSTVAIVNQNIEVIRESAINALKNPYEITQSYYTN